MNGERSALGQEIESALGEVLDHVRGETRLACRIVDDPSAERIIALRKRLRLSRQKFAERFGLDARAVQEWEQGRRAPDRAARVLLTVIDPGAVVRALGEDGREGRPVSLHRETPAAGLIQGLTQMVAAMGFRDSDSVHDGHDGTCRVRL